MEYSRRNVRYLFVFNITASKIYEKKMEFCALIKIYLLFFLNKKSPTINYTQISS